jgi:hypothetical protein
MEYLIGALLAIVVFAFAILAKVDQRVFYPLLLIIVALFYILFAAMAEFPTGADGRGFRGGFVSIASGGGVQEKPVVRWRRARGTRFV